MTKPITFDDINAGRDQCTEDVSDDAVDPNDVMTVQCASCPWRADNARLKLSPGQTVALTEMVLGSSNQRCHAPSLLGKPETKICRGARDLQLKYFHVLGVLKEPTDECWRTTLAEMTDGK